MTKDTSSNDDRSFRPVDDEDDVEGHGLATVLGLDAMQRRGSRAPREQGDPELPPLTRRFPSLRQERLEPNRKP